MQAGLDTGSQPFVLRLSARQAAPGSADLTTRNRVSFHAAASLIAFITLAACQTTPAVRTEIVEVATPIPVACVERSQIPAAPALMGKLPTDARAALDLTAAKLIEVRLYGRTLAALLVACAQEDIAR
jgi:hypothetical protein